MKYTYTEHTITDAIKLQNELILAGDLIPIFSINTDVYIESELDKSIIDAAVEAAGD